MIYLAIFALVLVVLYLLGNKSVHTEILIDKSPDTVWEVLVQTDAYKDWNPVMELLEGKLKQGNQVKYRFTQDKDNVSYISSTVKTVIPHELLHQGGGLAFVITFDHKYILEAKGNMTKLSIHEQYKGIYVNFWNPKPVELAYQRLNEAIKNRVESL
ncbi:MAG: SRPBCC domain-containing protein [Bacteroidota bacterium]